MIKSFFTTVIFSLTLITLSLAQAKSTLVTITSEFGVITVKLYNETPKHRDNFIKLAKEGFYDSTIFHRVINEFMIQGGDPDSKTAAPNAMLGNGGPGYTIPAEFNINFIHVKGALCAARQGDQTNPNKESSGSQFYIVQGRKYTANDLVSFEQRRNATTTQKTAQEFFNNPVNKSYQERLMKYQTEKNDSLLKLLFAEVQPKIEAEATKKGLFKYSKEQAEAYANLGGTPHLDGGYTVFGQVIEGMEIIDKIASVEVGNADRPKKDIKIIVKVVE